MLLDLLECDTARWIALEKAFEEGAEHGAEVGWVKDFLGKDELELATDIGVVKWKRADAHAVEDDSHGPDVDTVGVSASEDHFWGGVGWAPANS